MENKHINSRRELLKKAPWAVAIFVGLGAFVFQKGKKKLLVEDKHRVYSLPNVNFLTEAEANEQIRTATQEQKQFVPKPAPDKKIS